MTSVVIRGSAAALVNKYTNFDISAPQNTSANNFIFVNEASALEDGVLNPIWAGDGYRHVGFAELVVTILPTEDMLSSAVDALKAQKQKVIADAEAESTRIESEIQKLLAISYEAA